MNDYFLYGEFAFLEGFGKLVDAVYSSVAHLQGKINVIVNHELLETGTAGWTRTSLVDARTSKSQLHDSFLFYLES